MRVLVLAGFMLCATTQAVNEPLELNAPDVMEWEVGHARHPAAAGGSALSNLRILFRPSDRAQPSPTRAQDYKALFNKSYSGAARRFKAQRQ